MNMKYFQAIHYIACHTIIGSYETLQLIMHCRIYYMIKQFMHACHQEGKTLLITDILHLLIFMHIVTLSGGFSKQCS